MNDQATRVSKAFNLHQHGRLDEARMLYREALAADASDRDALHLLGVLELQSGAPQAAVACLEKAAEIEQRDPQIFANLGNACFAAGLLKQSVSAFERSLRLNPGSAETWAGLGNAFLSLGDFEQAIGHYQRALSLNASLAEVWRGLATALLSVGQPTQALAAIERADSELERAGAPVTPPFIMSRGNVLAALGRTRDALACFEQVVSAAPSFAQGYVSLGSAWRELGRPASALDCFDKALKLDPKSTEAHFALSLFHKDEGALDEARASLRRILDIDPAHGKAHRVLASLTRYSIDNEHLVQLHALASDDDLGGEQRKHVYFALGKALEDCAQYDDAFAAIDQANRLHRSSIRYSLDHDRQHMRIIATTFDATTLRSVRQDAGRDADGPTPIFIVGMPRSGTSLIEQILASHPDVYGAGELEWVDICTREVHRESNAEADEGTVELAQLVACGAEFADRIGDAYRARIKEHLARSDRSEARWFVDKLPANFLHVGLIRMAMPDALVIHSRRHPVATCWSIYKNYLGARGHGYSFDPGELGSYYRGYQALMAHWDNVLPDFVRHVDYEQLVSSQESQSRELLAACGIDWNETVLDFHRTRRPVKTLSASQVRQPIYTDSLAQWKRYERHLGPLIEALEACD